MKNNIILSIFLFIMITDRVYSQSDNCSTATNLTVTANCSSPVSGTTIGATQNIAGCVGTADDDVWYKFTATATSHIITVVPSASFDPVVQLFSGTCSSLISLNCMDNGLTGETETINASGLTIGTVYTIRVYHYYAGSGSGTFTICVMQAPTPPANDNCANSTLLSVNLACSYSNGTSVSATQSLIGCAGTADDDVWYKFIATNSVQTITVDPSSAMDPVIELFSGTCASQTSVTCMDNGFTDDNEVINAVGLIAGNTYYIRVYDYYSGTGGFPFQICITGTPTAAPTNDEPCNAIQLPEVSSACDFLSFTTVGATTSTTATAPTPSSCAGGSAPQQGGFNNAPQPKDVWFKFTVPSSGKVAITSQPGYGFSDAVMALYSGSCSSLTQIACSDDYNYPGGSNDYKPFILATGLTPGATVYLRYWAFNGNTTGVFGICVTTPTNDGCGGNLYICDLNNYAGTTSAAYTTDRPCNMRANAEVDITYAYTPGTCQGGIFGLGGTWGTGAPNCDVQINNNSWIKFTASNTSATLVVNIGNCFVGNYPSGGIQMQIFSAGSACCNFTPVSDFKEGSSQLSITANNLIIGNDYYLMIDGFAGDICNYSISASAGVQFPDITTASSSICIGQTITLNGPAGASAYEWSPGGQTTQNITVTPAYSQTYSLEATGVCGYRQTRTIFITVNNLPTATSSSNSPVCETQSINLTAGGGASYSWSGPGGWTSSSQNPARTNATTAMTGTYTVTVTSAAGCTSTSTTNVTVNSNPTATASNSGPFCESTTISLTSSGGTSYSWSGPGGWTSTAQNPSRTNATTGMAGTYYVTVTGFNGCIATANTAVTVNSNPSVTTGNSGPFCEGSTISLSSSGGTTYSWSGPGGWTSTLQNPTRTNSTPAMAGTYTVTVTNSNNCSATGTTIVTISPASVGGIATATPNSMCSGNTSLITVSGYTGTIQWQSSPNGSSWTNIPGATSTSYTTPALSTTTYYQAVLTSGTGCPSISSSTATVTVTAQSVGGTVSPANSTLCYNSSASLTLSGYSGSIQWQQSPNGSTWSDIPGATSSTLTTSNLTSTTYFHAVLSNAGCSPSNSNDAIITINPNLTAGTISSDQTFCAGLTPAGLTQGTAPTGGTGTYTYQWQSSTDNVNWFNISGATNNTYNPPSLNVTTYYRRNVTSGTCGTVSTNTVTITVYPNPVADAGTNQSIFNGANTTLAGSASGGSGTYSYSWTPSASLVNANVQNPQTVNLFSTTVFTLTVLDISTGCTGTDQVTVNITGGVLSVNASVNDYTVCRGTQIQLSAPGSGGSGNYTYTWSSNPPGFNSSIYNPTDYPTVNPTIYTVSVYDGTSTVTDTVNVTVYSLPIANAGTDVSICNGNSTTISAAASTGTPTLTFNWSSGNSGVSQTVSPTTLTTYTVTVTDGNGCTQTDAVDVTVHPLPSQFVVAGGGAYCSGGSGVSVTLSGSEVNVNYQLQLNNINTGVLKAGTGLSLTWNNLTSAGNYTVTATTSYTCTSPMLQSATITINPLPTPIISGDIDVCQGETVIYATTNISGHSYSWNISGGTPTTGSSSSVNITWGNSSPGIITLTETIAATSCAATTSSYAVSIYAPPVANAGLDDTICAGEQDTISAAGSTGNTPLSYLWNNGIGSGISHVVTPNGNITYTVTVTDVYQCTGTDQVSITVNSLPVIDAGNNVSICSGNSTTILVTPISGTLPFNYTWDNGLNSSTSHIVSPTSTTSYHVSVVDANQCSGTDSVIVYIFNSMDANAGTDKIICKGETATIDADLSSGGSQPLVFSWNNNLGNGSQHLVTPLVTTSYYLTVTDNNLCKDYDTVMVTVNSPPVADAGNDTAICSAALTQISAAASTGTIPLQFYWSNNIDTVTQIVFPNITTTYYVTVTDANSCVNTDSVKITIGNAPVANAGTDASVCKGASLNLDASLSTGSIPLSYLWNNNIGTSTNPSIVTDSSRIYIVRVTDVNNCYDTDSVSITIKQIPYFIIDSTNTSCAGNNDGKASVIIISAIYPIIYTWSTGSSDTNITELSAGNYSVTVTDSTSCGTVKSFEIKDAGDFTCLEIPSAFTPNTDGTNDTWVIKHINIYPKATIEIYNRWGEIIFSSDNYSNPQNSWDGKYKGNDVTAGPYVYILNLHNDTNPIQGVVTVIR